MQISYSSRENKLFLESQSRGEGMGYKWWIGDIVILASYEFHFIRVHENLVSHPSNNT